MIEEFKDIKNYEDVYQITSYGRIYSKILKKFRKLPISKDGYSYIDLWDKGSFCTFRVHRLVAEAFCYGQTEEKNLVNHKDLNKLNNYYKNLEWCTHSMNNKHAFDTELKENKKSYTKDEEIEIIKLRKSGLRAKDIQEIFPHLKIYVIQKLYEKYGLTREVKDTSKFSILEKKEIKYKLINRTESITDISKKIGIDRRTAGRIINELIWKEIVL